MFFCDDPKATSYGQTNFDFGYTETALRSATELTDQVLTYIQEFRGSGQRKLFLWVHYFDVHEPYERHPGISFGESKLDLYDGEISYVDQSIGRLVAGASQLLGPTIFILTSDHGEEFKEHGGYYHGSSLYDEQIRVPLLVGVPGVTPRVDRRPAQLVDVVPTVLSLLGQRIPESVRGRSLVPALIGRDEPDRPAFSEVHTKKMVRLGDWKLIHDYRRRTDELYHLSVDPRERTNLITRRPVEAARLRSRLNRWFDQIRAVAGTEEKDRPEAIDLGRIGDRRSVPLLARLLLDPLAASPWRTEAARLLGGLQDRSVADQLWLAVGDDDRSVAAEAAIALGEIKDRRARIVLPQVIRSTDLELRMRAGIALGRVDGREATPALIHALYSSNWEIQNRAAHYLGFVGDRRALQPLLTASSLHHLRPRTCLSLGRLGVRLKDQRILARLLELAERDPHAEVRQRALAGLGFLGDRRAIRPLAKLLGEEPDLIWAAEALARIGGIGSYWLPGADFTPARRGLSKEGWGDCVNTATILIDDFHEASWCVMIQPAASLQLTLQRKPFAADLTLRVRMLEARLRGTSLVLTVNGVGLPPAKLSSTGWHSFRFATEARHWRQGKNTVRLQLLGPGARALAAPSAAGLIAVDHLLLLPAKGR
jgi:HEAT repeat protein